MSHLDMTLLEQLNNWASQIIWVRYLTIFLAHWLIYFMVLTVCIFIFWSLLPIHSLSRRVRGVVLLSHSLFAAGFTLLLGKIISVVLFRSRPFVSLIGIKLLIAAPVTAKSFPSDHATIAFAMAVTVLMFNRRLGWWLLVAAVGVALGRVMAGVHYPSDVLAGAVLGSVGALVIFWFGRKMSDTTVLKKFFR